MSSPCDSCRDPGACCRAFTVNIDFPVGMERDEVREHVRKGTDPFGGRRRHEKLPHFEPLRPSRWWAGNGARRPERVNWMFDCAALGPDGRCTVYDDRPDVCRAYEPKSDPMCVEFDGPWRGRMFKLPGREVARTASEETA